MAGDEYSMSRREGLTYEQQMDLLGSCVRTLLHFDVDAMLDTVNRADSVGFLTDPTLYREALLGRRLEHQRALLTKVRELQQTVAEIEKDVRERQMRRDSAFDDEERRIRSEQRHREWWDE